MKLLLDEQFSHQIAEQLRKRGCDVQAVTHSPLEQTPDEPLVEIAVEQRRALVTNNVGDFAPINQRWMQSGRSHNGLIYTSDSSRPRDRGAFGSLIEALAEFLDAHPADDALRDGIHWL